MTSIQTPAVMHAPGLSARASGGSTLSPLRSATEPLRAAKTRFWSS